jgi:hypothetical protein
MVTVGLRIGGSQNLLLNRLLEGRQETFLRLGGPKQAHFMPCRLGTA